MLHCRVAQHAGALLALLIAVCIVTESTPIMGFLKNVTYMVLGAFMFWAWLPPRQSCPAMRRQLLYCIACR